MDLMLCYRSNGKVVVDHVLCCCRQVDGTLHALPMENAIATITPGHVKYLTYRYGDQLAKASIYCLNLYGSVSIMLAVVLRLYSHCCNHGKKLQHA